MNASAHIELEGESPRPFGKLKGTVKWGRDERPGRLELRLFWMTRGRGTEELGIIDRRPLEVRPGETPFEFELPAGPYSCSGRLVSIVWAVELVDDDGDGVALREFVLSPDGRERLLESVDKPRSESRAAFGFRKR